MLASTHTRPAIQPERRPTAPQRRRCKRPTASVTVAWLSRRPPSSAAFLDSAFVMAPGFGVRGIQNLYVSLSPQTFQPRVDQVADLLLPQYFADPRRHSPKLRQGSFVLLQLGRQHLLVI